MVPTGPDFPLTATDLSRWTRFGVKGGIGRAEALTDKLAEGAEELMFLQGDEIVVLLDLEGGSYLVSLSSGSQEGWELMECANDTRGSVRVSLGGSLQST